ncbi:DUF2155 domain-containing protein [Ostreiculturibacter nitratireducens]|uniref:DUF2155 domain-containing protein n=1 Tax=Ostreiculturibacter nitratireducens TaxID=3075226 RepID=UPI0031B5B5E6
MIRAAIILALALAAPAAAQDLPEESEGGVLVIPGNDPSLDFLFPKDPTLPEEPGAPGGIEATQLSPPAPAPREVVESAPGAILRGLDKVSGEVTELDLATGETASFGRLKVTLHDCRYPVDDPSSDAYAHLEIDDTVQKQVVFDAWMIASSPALSALDHARYDVWVIRCKSSSDEGTETAKE